jgi:hypothetical protein
MPLTNQELMRQYFAEETARIADWDIDNHPENYKLLEAKIAEFEAINYESKARAARLHEEKRRIDLKEWDGKVQRKTLADPRQAKLNKQVKAKTVELTKLEKLVDIYTSQGWADKDILDNIPESKFKRSEVWIAIRKMRGDSGPVLTEEQKQGIAQEEAEEAKQKAEEEKARKAAKEEAEKVGK